MEAVDICPLTKEAIENLIASHLLKYSHLYLAMEQLHLNFLYT